MRIFCKLALFLGVQYLAGILSGDMVVVRPQDTADDGPIVIARIGDEATVKRV